MLYHDKPKPTSAYLVLILALAVLIVIVPAVLTFTGIFPVTVSIFVLVMYIALLIFFILIFQAAFRTEYWIDKNVVRMKAGIIMNVTISADEIRSIKKVKFIRRVLGWGIAGRGVCNRFTKGIKITTAGSSIYISPDDPDKFISVIKSIIQRD